MERGPTRANYRHIAPNQTKLKTNLKEEKKSLNELTLTGPKLERSTVIIIIIVIIFHYFSTILFDRRHFQLPADEIGVVAGRTSNRHGGGRWFNLNQTKRQQSDQPPAAAACASEEIPI